ncbi:peroxidasin homolog isoform X2 [Orbicella faveolata]|uniref:peroxidasin homolog isoform X2 n=1 Tax=Orbicella faveolata TaxID=48498 RepID=UPI0009E1C682|nr:peroxidasin homolog isoform X2 [Orbicella faveolata]
MIVQKNSSTGSFIVIISVLSVFLYCGGFLRVELVLHQHQERIIELEEVVEGLKTIVNDGNRNLFKNQAIHEFQPNNPRRNKRHADLTKNATGDQSTEDVILKINKLLSQLHPSKGHTCSNGLPGPPGPPGARGKKGARGRRGEKGRTGKKGDKGIMGYPGISGKQGIMGPVGMKGETGIKGIKGSMGPQGMPGAKGEPGESLSAPGVVISPVKLTVNEKGAASFRCSAGGNPEPSVVWTRADNHSEITQSALSEAMLHLENLTESDSGLYQCSAINILGQAQSLARLVVNVHPRVSLHPGPHYAIEGSNFTFPSCHVIGHPSPVVTWRKLSGKLPQERVQYNNSGLQISNVRKTDSDTYFCSAVNLVGTTEKSSLLVVVSLPRFHVKPPVRVVIRKGDTLTLNCSATGDPKPVVSWKKHGAQLPAERSLQTNGVLVLRDVKISDEGYFICVAASAGVFEAETLTYIDVRNPGPWGL